MSLALSGYMATFGHLATGLVAGRLLGNVQRRPRMAQAAFGTLAMLPDLDHPGLRHDGPTSRTHTPAAVLVGAAVTALVAAGTGLPPWRSFLAAVISLGSQPVLDAMTHGKGEAVYWPFSTKRYFRRVPGLPTWKPEKGTSASAVRSLVGELAWSAPLFIAAALPLERSNGQGAKRRAPPTVRAHT